MFSLEKYSSMISLDPTDLKILSFLQQDSRQTIKEISARLGLSTTPIFERIKKLEKNGFIKQYKAVLNPALLGKKLIVFINVSLQTHSKKSVEKFVEELKCFPEIQELHHVSGDADFLIKVLLEDMESYNDFVLNRLGLVENVANVRSQFALSTRIQSQDVAVNI